MKTNEKLTVNYFLVILVCHWMSLGVFLKACCPFKLMWSTDLTPEATPTSLLTVFWLGLGQCSTQKRIFTGPVEAPMPTSSDYSSHWIVVKRWDILACKTEKHLIKQFCHGCWNKTVITNLQLEGKKDNPPSFTELLGKTPSRSDSLAMTASNWHSILLTLSPCQAKWRRIDVE